jgi:hypothetical protein
MNLDYEPRNEDDYRYESGPPRQRKFGKNHDGRYPKQSIYVQPEGLKPCRQRLLALF